MLVRSISRSIVYSLLLLQLLPPKLFNQDQDKELRYDREKESDDDQCLTTDDEKMMDVNAVNDGRFEVLVVVFLVMRSL